MSNPKDIIEYDQGLKNTIQQLFIHKIVPSNFIYLIHKHDPNVLTDPDVRRVVKSMESKIDIEVNMELLDLMTHYKGWFECLLKVLGDPALKQVDLIKYFKSLRDKFDEKWKAEKRGATTTTTTTTTTEAAGPRRGKKDTKKNDSAPNAGVPESGGKPSACKENGHSDSAQAGLGEVKGQQKKAGAKVKSKEGASELVSDSPKKDCVPHSNNKKGNPPLGAAASLSKLNKMQTGKAEVAKEKKSSPKPPLQVQASQEDFCSICKAVLKTPQIAAAHYSGKKHQKNVEEEEEKLKSSAQANTLQAAGPTVQRQDNGTLQADSIFPDSKIYTLNEKGQGTCHLCGVTLASQQIADDHFKGKGHKKKMETFDSSKAK